MDIRIRCNAWRLRFQSLVLLGICSFLDVLGAKGQTQLEYQIQAAPAACAYDPFEMNKRGNQLLRWGKASGNCDSIMLAEYLLLQAAVVNQQPREDLLELSCPSPPGLLLYVHGANAHQLDQYERAAQSFLSASEISHSSKGQFNSLMAAGCVFRDWGKYERAYAIWKKAYENYPDQVDSFFSIFNLSSAAIHAAAFEDALKWCDLAEKTLNESQDQDVGGQNRDKLRLQVENNRLVAWILLKDQEEAAATFHRIKSKINKSTISAEITGNLVGYLLWRDDFPQFDAMSTTLNEFAISDSSATTDLMGASVTLFEPWRSSVWGEKLPEEVWEELRKLPSVLQLNQTVIPSKTASTVAWQAGLNGVTSPHLWMVLTALLGLSVGMYILRHQAQFRSVAVSMATQSASRTELMEWVASGQRVSAQTTAVLRAQWSALRLLQRHLEPSKLSRLTGFGTLNARERAFLEHVALGQRSKDFARLHGLSAGYVYNLSSSVRAKLNVPENQDLAQWLESQ